jgi:DNA-binding response OmpR family regulator
MIDRGKILVVDDAASLRDLFQRFFAEAGYNVLLAEGGRQDLVVLELHDTNVIFINLKLFGMNGIELCHQIRKTRPVSMAYAMTGWSATYKIDGCREAGLI